MAQQKVLKIETLGGFAVTVAGKTLSEKSTRASQLWKLFKYIITNRTVQIPTEKLIDILWPDSDCDDPLKALYSLVYRLRATLNGPFDKKQEFILFKHDCYSWNTEAPYELDAETFERLYHQAASESDSRRKYELLDKAFSVYRGNYLAESSFEIWSLPTVNYYKRLYSSIVQQLAQHCAQTGDYQRVLEYCQTAIEFDPYEEALHYDLIDALVHLDQTAQAVAHYNYLAGVLYSELGVNPSDRMAELYKQIYASNHQVQYNIKEIAASLREEAAPGVFFCDPEVFRKVYQLEVRSLERSPVPIFLCAVTLLDDYEGAPNGIRLTEGMSRLKRIVMLGLRRGDVVTQYSDSQLLLLLPTLTAENCSVVANRIKSRFDEWREGEGLSLKFSFMPLPTKK